MSSPPYPGLIADVEGAETQNTWHRPDPSFTYLLSLFLIVTALGWGLAYTPSAASVARLVLVFVVLHFLCASLLIATLAYLLVGRFLGAGVPGLPGRRRPGRFGPLAGSEPLEFGYCFDVARTSPFPPLLPR